MMARSFAEQLTTHLNELSSAPPAVIAEHLVGVHAARVVSPLPIVAARTNDSIKALPVLDFAPDGDLIRVRCMRKTLHILPRALARIAHAATRRYRVRDAARALVVRGLTPDEYELLARRTEQIVAAHGSGTPGILAEHIALKLKLHDQRVAALLLKYCWEAGDLFVWRSPSSWDAERRMIGADATLRAYFAELDAEDAQDQLLGHYFERFGPASVRDASWWSGLSAGAVRRHIAGAGDRYAEYSAPWSPSTLYGIAGRDEAHPRHAIDDLADADRRYTFLGHEDPILKAYFESRGRYVDDVNYDRLYNQIGEARPALVANGHIVGIWQWDRQDRTIATQLFPRYSKLRPDAAAAGDVHTTLLRAAFEQQELAHLA